MQFQLRYGCNPHQRAHFEPVGGACPIEIVHGTPSYINLLDALNGWQLVRNAALVLERATAASFKHVSPAGVALGNAIADDEAAGFYDVEERPGSIPVLAYARARGCDPKSSYGDIVAHSSPIDTDAARFLATCVVDGIIAPDYDTDALDILKLKRKGQFLILRADPTYSPPELEAREIYGLRLTQQYDSSLVARDEIVDVPYGSLDAATVDDIVLGLITLRYTQSNSIAFVRGGETLGIAAGQQSRVDCTRLAAAKAAVWHLRHHPTVMSLRFLPHVRRQDRVNARGRFIEADLSESEANQLKGQLETLPPRLTALEKSAWLERVSGVTMVSDGYIPFPDNIALAAQNGVNTIAAPRGSIKDDEVLAACRHFGVTMVRTRHRYFHH